MNSAQRNILIILLAISSIIYAQANGNDLGIALNYNYTTTSKMFFQPNAVDPVVRASYDNLDNIYDYSVEVRYVISESVALGAGTEYIKKTFGNSINLGGTKIKTTDGYRMVPVELSIYYLIPFSLERFKFFMGGGIGFYSGSQIREFGDENISNVARKIGFGIHVAVGMDYVVKNFLSLRFQMRFRDPQFEMTGKYSNQTVKIDDRTFILPPGNFNTKVNIDGVTFTLGAVINVKM